MAISQIQAETGKWNRQKRKAGEGQQHRLGSIADRLYIPPPRKRASHTHFHGFGILLTGSLGIHKNRIATVHNYELLSLPPRLPFQPIARELADKDAGRGRAQQTPLRADSQYCHPFPSPTFSTSSPTRCQRVISLTRGVHILQMR